jgi:hypothetical protein
VKPIKMIALAVCLSVLTMTVFSYWSVGRFFALLVIYFATILIGEWSLEKNY